jgi:transcriptional regulator with XRE-family HTH domain
MESHRLSTARNAVTLSQRELGLRVAEITTGKAISDKYAQKKVSLWESGQTRPTPSEFSALAKILGVPEAEVETWFARLPSSAAELFTQLADSDYPSLVAACYSGRPRAPFDTEVFEALLKGIERNMSLAMFFPYPSEFEVRTESSIYEDLLEAYRSVWTTVRSHHENLYSQSRAPQRDKQLALFIPDVLRANVFLPPSASRYTLVINLSGDGTYEKSLHIWVESETVEGLFRVGTFSIQDAQPQLIAWQAYFGAVVEYWTKFLSLPDSAPPWIRRAPKAIPTQSTRSNGVSLSMLDKTI